MPLTRPKIKLPAGSESPLKRLLVRLVVAIALMVFVTLVAFVERDAYRDANGSAVTLLDCFYSATVSITTTGYGDIIPVTDSSRLVTALLVTPARILFLIILRPREVALDGAFGQHKSREQLTSIDPERIFVSGRHEPGSRRTRKRRARYRTGAEGRISHLNRGYGLRRSRLKAAEGQQIWTGWAILAYNLDTLAVHTA